MIEHIEPLINTIPEPLRRAALKKTLIPFIGAGVSQLGGCPGWNEFAHKALSFFVENGKLSHAELNQISSLPSRVKLSIARELQTTHQLQIDFRELLLPSELKKATGDNIYANLSKIATTFVTTNYDPWLDEGRYPWVEGARAPFFKHSDITTQNLDVPNAVFHIHGSVTDPDNMVLTTVDYLDRYASHRLDDGQGKNENPFLTFLQNLFKLKSVLFVGYSLGELEILEYVLQKGMAKSEQNEEPQHYVLQGFFSHELELARNLESYFASFGVGLIPFSRDANDWEQLVSVIEDLGIRLSNPPNPGPELLAKLQEMEGLL